MHTSYTPGNDHPTDRLANDPVLQTCPLLLRFTEELCLFYKLTDDAGVDWVLDLLRGLDADRLWVRITGLAIECFARVIEEEEDDEDDRDATVGDLDPAVVLLAKHYADAARIDLETVLERAARIGSDHICVYTVEPAVDELQIALGLPL